MFVFYATNGASDMTYIFFASFTLFCFVAWGRSGSARYIIGGGLAVALAALTHYEFIIWAVFLGFVIAAALATAGRGDLEIQGTVIAFLAPLFYAAGIWILFNAAVIGDPFGWISQSGEPVNAALTASPDFGIGEAIRNVVRVELHLPAHLADGAAAVVQRHATGDLGRDRRADPDQHRLPLRPRRGRRQPRGDRAPRRAAGDGRPALAGVAWSCTSGGRGPARDR